MALDVHDEFVRWAIGQGVQIDGLKPAKLPNKGIGMIASKPLKKGDQLVFVPTKTLITIKSTPFHSKKYQHLTVHGRLAAHLASPTAPTVENLKCWNRVFPTKAETKQSMPLFWPAEAQNSLPPAAKALLGKQKTKFEKDLKEAFPLVATIPYTQTDTRTAYEYYWMLVNTRCFYWDGASKGKNVPRDDCMAMCPFIDYFNHDNEGCSVNFTDYGYTVTCDRVYETGDEVTVSYGSHTNENLLVEYGFIMNRNNADHTLLDHVLIPRFSEKQAELLKHNSLFGNYVIDHKQVCHRTQAALRLLVLNERRWQRFVTGHDDGRSEQPEVDEICAEIVAGFLKESDDSMERARLLEVDPDIKMVVIRCWEQIQSILQAGMQNLDPPRKTLAPSESTFLAVG